MTIDAYPLCWPAGHPRMSARSRERARATSFDDEGVEYQFCGTATEITKQIGNAVPNRTVKAHVRALMEV